MDEERKLSLELEKEFPNMHTGSYWCFVPIDKKEDPELYELNGGGHWLVLEPDSTGYPNATKRHRAFHFMDFQELIEAGNEDPKVMRAYFKLKKVKEQINA